MSRHVPFAHVRPRSLQSPVMLRRNIAAAANPDSKDMKMFSLIRLLALIYGLPAIGIERAAVALRA